jgi:hypothetical protein
MYEIIDESNESYESYGRIKIFIVLNKKYYYSIIFKNIYEN